MKNNAARSENDRSGEENGALDAVLEEVVDALRGLRFGQVTIVVQDGVVVQIDRVERRRIQRRTSRSNDQK